MIASLGFACVCGVKANLRVNVTGASDGANVQKRSHTATILTFANSTGGV